MSKDSSARYYHKKTSERYQDLSAEVKTKNENMDVNDVKIFLKIKSKG